MVCRKEYKSKLGQKATPLESVVTVKELGDNDGTT